LAADLLILAAGVALGFRFRAGALIAATLVVVILSLVLRVRAYGFGWLPLRLTIESAILLQLGYLAGLGRVFFWRNFRRK
jgi:hypothetical protein